MQRVRLSTTIRGQGFDHRRRRTGVDTGTVDCRENIHHARGSDVSQATATVPPHPIEPRTPGPLSLPGPTAYGGWMGRTGHSAGHSSRRALLRTAGWSVPAVSASLAAPALAASTGGSRSNEVANYSWEAESQGIYSELHAAADARRAQFSVQTAYRADPWVAPPAEATMVLTLVFSGPVSRFQTVNGWVQRAPAGAGPATTFVFARETPAFGPALTVELLAGQAGPLSVSTTMLLENGGTTTWTHSPNTAEAVLAD